MAADDLRGDGRLDVGQVEDAGLGRELGVQDDLEPQVAELAGQLRSWRPPRARRRPRRPPRAGACGARRGSARGPTGSRRAGAAGPRSRASPRDRRAPAPGRSGRGRAAPSRAASSSVADRRPVVQPEPPDRMVGRVEPPQERRPGSRPAGPARPGIGAGRPRSAVARSIASGHDQQRARRLDGRRHERLGRVDLQARRRIESPAEPCLRDERVEHPALPPSWPCRWIRPGVIVTADFFASYHFEKVVDGQLLELAALGRPGLLGEDLEQVRAVVLDGRRRRRSCRSASRRSRRPGLLVELALGRPSRGRRRCRTSGPPSCRGRGARSRRPCPPGP